MRKIILSLCSISILHGCATTGQQTLHTSQIQATGNERPSAKDVFLGDNEAGAKGLAIVQQADTTPAGKPKSAYGPVTHYQGLTYWIERLGYNGKQRVTASTTFHDGDRIRFHLRSNRSGYLYVVTQGTSGRSTYLFPSKAGENEYIEANRNYTIPSQASIVFDAHPGKELIWLFLSKQPLPASNAAGANRQSGAISNNVLALNNCGSKDLLITSPESVQSQCADALGGRAKDILIEDDAAAPEPAGYAVIPQEQIEQGAILSLKLELRHE